MLLQKPTPRFPRNFQDGLTASLIVDDLHIPKLQPLCLVGPQASVRHEQNVVVQVFVLFEPRPALGIFDPRRGRFFVLEQSCFELAAQAKVPVLGKRFRLGE